MDQQENARTLQCVLADGCEMVRIGLRTVLEEGGPYRVAREYGDASALRRWRAEQRADLVILDADVDPSDPAALVRELTSGRRAPRVIVFTWRAERSLVLRLLRAGAQGYLLKSAARQELLHGVSAVLGGENYLSPAVATVISSLVTSSEWRREPQAIEEPLSERELEVLREIVAGKTSKEIAVELRVKARTVESHRAQVMKKLNLRSVAALTKYAIREGLASLNS